MFGGSFRKKFGKHKKLPKLLFSNIVGLDLSKLYNYSDKSKTMLENFKNNCLLPSSSAIKSAISKTQFGLI